MLADWLSQGRIYQMCVNKPVQSLIQLFLVLINWNFVLSFVLHSYVLQLWEFAASIWLEYSTKQMYINVQLFFLCCFRDMVQIFTQKKNTMKENGTETKEVVGDECIIKMEQYMKVNGMMINAMVKECWDFVSKMITGTMMVFYEWNVSKCRSLYYCFSLLIYKIVCCNNS